MGHVLAELTKMGLENVGFELVTDVLTFRTKNGPRKMYEVTSDDLAMAFVKENASFAAIQLVNHFKENDRTDGMAYKALRKLVQKGAIKKLRPSNYQRAGVKALAPPAPKGKTGKRPARNYEISNKDVILKRIKGRARFTVVELEDHFRNIKRNPRSVSSIVAYFFQEKMIMRVDAGTYAWGKKKIAKKKQVRKKRDTPVASSSLEQTNG